MSKKSNCNLEQFDAYGTHLPTLTRLLEIIKPKTTFEFGCGRYSTAVFTVHSAHHTAVEQQDAAYMIVLAPSFKKEIKAGTLNLFSECGATGGHTELNKRKYDLVMVDGHQLGRAVGVNAAFKVTDTILAHDTNDQRYSWEGIKVPSGWQRFDFKEMRPWTTVWTKNATVISELKEKE